MAWSCARGVALPGRPRMCRSPSHTGSKEGGFYPPGCRGMFPPRGRLLRRGCAWLSPQ